MHAKPQLWACSYSTVMFSALSVVHTSIEVFVMVPVTQLFVLLSGTHMQIQEEKEQIQVPMNNIVVRLSLPKKFKHFIILFMY